MPAGEQLVELGHAALENGRASVRERESRAHGGPVAGDRQATSATAVFDDGEITIRVLVDAANLPLHPVEQSVKRGPTVLLGVVWPRAEGSLEWVATSKDRPKVSIEVGVFVTPSPVVDDVPCEKLALDVGNFDVRQLITKKQNLPKRYVARDGVDLHRRLVDPPSAQLDGGVQVEVLEVRGKMTQVLHDTPSFLVVGWVKSSDLTTVPGPGFGYSGGRAAYGRGFSSFRGDVCAKDLPLVVVVGNEVVRVGTIRAKTSFQIFPEPEADRARRKNDRTIRIELPRQRWFELIPGAGFFLTRAELDDCS